MKETEYILAGDIARLYAIETALRETDGDVEIHELRSVAIDAVMAWRDNLALRIGGFEE